MIDSLAQLRIFVAIADHGSLASAARALSLSPATVTMSLQRLEDVLGTNLIARTTRRLSLTEEGERFSTDARRILAEIRQATDAVRDSGRLRGSIRVTATVDFGRAILAPLIDGFIELQPEISIILMLSDSVTDLAESGFDLGVRMAQLGSSRKDQRLLTSGVRHVCASPSYWDKMGRPTHPDELARHNCLVLTRPDSAQNIWHFQEGGRHFGVRVSGNRSVNEGATLRHWAIGGAGVVLKSSIDIRDDLLTGRLEPVLQDYAILGNNLYAIYPPGRRPSRRTEAFVEFLAEGLAVRG
ncbi:LysR family transcriptional regulator [Agrobacterium sp. NPDC058088]|uniref:LysR family transcriptional regulator n=1 Tax=Agrobacterium sp. NPDC058088 TaxID=3346335 RepID=UPI0036DE76F7